MMKVAKFGLIAFLVFIFFCCGSQKTEWQGTLEEIEGVTVVKNPKEPMYGQEVLSMEEELSIGEVERDGSQLLNNPQDIKVTDNGDILVLDWGDYCIKVFNSKGEFLHSIGREGQGSGEFQIPIYFSIDKEKNIYLLDGGNSRIIIMDIEGNQVSGFKLSGGRFTGIEIDNQNFLYLAKEFREDKGMMSILRYTAEGEETLNFCKFRIVHPYVKEKSESNPYITTSKSLPTKPWNITCDGKLFVGSDDKYQINVFNSEGMLFFKFGREYKPIPYNNLYDSLESYRYMSVYARNRLYDEKGNFWIELFNESDSKDFVYDVFSSEGIYLKQVYTRFRIYHFKEGKAFSLVSTDEGFYVVKRFRVIE